MFAFVDYQMWDNKGSWNCSRGYF